MDERAGDGRRVAVSLTGERVAMGLCYDSIGIDYANLRQPDARIAATILRALGPAHSVLNIGAGSGSYEPDDRPVLAVEPSMTMIAQRPAEAAPVVCGRAEALPFADDSFDVALAILTVHHWADLARGLAEMRRVARENVVILTFDPEMRDYWLADYFPGLVRLDDAQMPRLSELDQRLGGITVEIVPVPHDCTDGFLGAYWRRPEAYLDPRIRAAMSSFWALGDVTASGERLRADLESGRWAERYGALIDRDGYDFGYRLVTASCNPPKGDP